MSVSRFCLFPILLCADTRAPTSSDDVSSTRLFPRINKLVVLAGVYIAASQDQDYFLALHIHFAAQDRRQAYRCRSFDHQLLVQLEHPHRLDDVIFLHQFDPFKEVT